MVTKKNLTHLTGTKYKVVGDGLAIEKVTLNDEGDYHCRAFQLSNDKSNIIERTITLKVQREYYIHIFVF